MSMPSHRHVENLIGRYAELVDDGDFAAVGKLFADGTFAGGGGAYTGSEAVTGMLHAQIRVYPDGTPRTRHMTTNLIVEVDENAGTARARSSVTILQETPELPLQPIVVGRYRDEFQRDGEAWRFTSRRVNFQLIGDLTHHLKPSSAIPEAVAPAR
jgi:3-phenylpropionate/cinnamic acid dioxygenase small subunit